MHDAINTSFIIYQQANVIDWLIGLCGHGAALVDEKDFFYWFPVSRGPRK